MIKTETDKPALKERIRRHYADAIQVQDACNLSGVVHSLSRAVTDLWEHAHEHGGGTDYVNHHPIVTLYLSKLASLNAGGESNLADQFSVAYELCCRGAERAE